MVHSIIIPLPLDAHISIKQSIYSENIIINYMTIMIKNYAARLDIVKISVFLVFRCLTYLGRGGADCARSLLECSLRKIFNT